MTRVKVTNCRGTREMEMCQALEPTPYDSDSGGITERAQATANEACEAFGRLAEKLYEAGVLSLIDLTEASGIYADIEVIKE